MWASRKLDLSGRASFCGDFQMDGNAVIRPCEISATQYSRPGILTISQSEPFQSVLQTSSGRF